MCVCVCVCVCVYVCVCVCVCLFVCVLLKRLINLFVVYVLLPEQKCLQLPLKCDAGISNVNRQTIP